MPEQHQGSDIRAELEIYVEDYDIMYLKITGDDDEIWEEEKLSSLSEINKLLEWLYE